MNKEYFSLTLLKERVSLRIFFIALVVAVVGLAVLYFASLNALWTGHETWQIVIRDIGSLLMVTVAITLLWELFGKRAFMDEVLAKVGLSKEIAFSGLVKITASFHQDIDWPAYFKTVNKLDIFIAYGKTWRNTHNEELKNVASRDGARIRVVLPDPEDVNVVAELTRRFSYSGEQLRTYINESIDYFKNVRPKGKKGGSVSIWLVPLAPQFSFYRFDNIAITALYTHRKGRTPVPTFVCDENGVLYDYMRQEFDYMISEASAAKLVYASTDA